MLVEAADNNDNGCLDYGEFLEFIKDDSSSKIKKFDIKKLGAEA